MPEILTFPMFVSWAFLGVIAAGIAWAAKSLASLNVKIAVVIEKTMQHEKELERHEKRINELEYNRQ